MLFRRFFWWLRWRRWWWTWAGAGWLTFLIENRDNVVITLLSWLRLDHELHHAELFILHLSSLHQLLGKFSVTLLVGLASFNNDMKSAIFHCFCDDVFMLWMAFIQIFMATFIIFRFVKLMVICTFVLIDNIVLDTVISAFDTATFHKLWSVVYTVIISVIIKRTPAVFTLLLNLLSERVELRV